MPLHTGECLTAGKAEAWLEEKHYMEFGKNSIYYQLEW